MKIKELFTRDISRSINGVVKADQLDDASVWQELDEFVVTREIKGHLNTFISAYVGAIDEPTDNIGVWVSGFFGSGKSHFIKVLSYLLQNKTHTYQGESKQAVAFFQDKVEDAMLFGEIQRAVASNTDVILFNIDSKAESDSGRSAILSVFLKVFNELQGYSGDHPKIAHMERYLEGRDLLETFHTEFRERSGSAWLKERDAYVFKQDEVVAALAATLVQSEEAVSKWIDGADESFALSVEHLCKWVKEYLDAKGPAHRLVFLVDEIGQFIGTDTHLMLNLQTITEELGTLCQGRAWVVVTSQEDIDAVLGEINTTRANDFSKIQGRFKTRLTLSSANVDEVIHERLLSKRTEVEGPLRAMYGEKGDILKNQLTFRDVGMTFRTFKNDDDFVHNYPCAPYQFQLVQRIFESIRKAGATGLHLSRGERSILDAFQSATQQLADAEIGVLVPLYRFYPSIESFLDTAVKRTIDQAARNAALESADITLLKVLFLIRYVDEVRGNVDNLVTLCVDEVDADRLKLRRQIEDSLQRLEKETLISRSGDNYIFLTNEERDVNREIKSVELSGGEEARLSGQLIFDEIYKGQNKHRYAVNKKDFNFNRICDGYPVGTKTDGDMTVAVVTPLSDDYEMYTNQRCILDSSAEGGQVLIKVGDDDKLGRELRSYLQTDKYIKTKGADTLPDATRRIHRDLADDNRNRRNRLRETLSELLLAADYFVSGQTYAPDTAAPAAGLEKALAYLVTNTFTKMSYIRALHDHPQAEMQAMLRSNDVEQLKISDDLPESNPQALDDVRGHIALSSSSNRQMVLHDMIEKRYGSRPYGWPEWETLLILGRLIALEEIRLLLDGAELAKDKVYEAVSKPGLWRKIVVIQRKSPDAKTIQAARSLGKDLFSEMGPDGEDGLFQFLQNKLAIWRTHLLGYESLANTGEYPGRDEIVSGLSLVKKLLADTDSYAFLERINTLQGDIIDFSDDYHDLAQFYDHQKTTWDNLRKARARFQLNKLDLDRNEEAAKGLQRIGDILDAPSPYQMIHEAEGLIHTVKDVNNALVSRQRGQAIAKIDSYAAGLSDDLKDMPPDTIQNRCLHPLQTIRRQAEEYDSLPHISQAVHEAERAYDEAVEIIENYIPPKKTGDGTSQTHVPKVKKKRVIIPADLCGKTFLETRDEAAEFLDRLNKQINEAIDNDERIEIR